ncbi:MAG: Ig-like domain-containing protein [Lachnospiraceae bacterium]
MGKGYKKAISFIMAVCILAGSGYTGRMTQTVTVTPVAEMSEETGDGKVAATTEEKPSLLDTVGASFARVSDFLKNRIKVANAAPTTSEWRYVLELTGAIIEQDNTAIMERNEVTVVLNRVNLKGEKDMSVVRSVVFSSDNPDIIRLSQSGTSAKLTAGKPGWAMIRAAIVEEDGTMSSFSAAFLVSAELDRSDSEWKNVGETERVLILDPTLISEYQLKFKNLDPADNSTCVKFSDPNTQGVVLVDANGKLTIQGAGCAQITIKNFANVTITDGNTEQVVVEESKIDIVVLPTGGYQTEDEDAFQKTVDMRVRGEEFVLHTNAMPASRLTWEVYTVKQDGSKGKLITQNDTSLLSYTYDGSSVIFSNVKAGTYRVEAYATKQFENASSNDLPCLTFNVVVELVLSADSAKYLNVGDIYDINKDFNIPDGMFGKLFEIIPDPTTEKVASIDRNTGIVTAHTYGTQTFTLVYKKSDEYGIYTLAEANTINPFTYTIEVLDTLSVDPSSLTIFAGGTYQLVPNQTRPGTVSWECSEYDSQYISVSENGLITALKETPKNYEATVIASQMIDDVKKTATCKVTVQQAVTQITLSPSEVTIGIGEIKSVEAIMIPSGWVDVNLMWQSSNTNVFTIVAVNGPTSAQIKGVAGGTAILTAITDKNVVVGYCAVTVKQPAQKLTLSQDKVTGNMRQTHQLYATISPENTTNQTLLWSSSNKSIVTVDKTGKLTFVKAGTAVITVQSEDNPALIAQCTVTVLQSVAGVELDVDTVEMYTGESKRLTYMVYPSSASNPDVEWTSFNTSVVAVNKEGMLTAKGPGITQVMVMSYDGSYYDICTVIVKQKATGVKMNYSEITMNSGEYFDMEVTITPATSTEANLTWESLNTKVVTVSSTGRITARSVGTAIILVKTESGATSYCTVTVLEAVRSMELDPSELVIDVGETFTIEPVFKPATASNTQVKWGTSDASVAKISAAGTVTGVSRGTAVITCESVDGGYRAFCLVTVEDPLIMLKIDPSSYRLGYGKTQTLRAYLVKEGVEIGDAEVEWYSSDDSICTVDKSGTITGINYGYATITAETIDGSDITAKCEVRVVREVTSIKLNHSALTIIQGQSAALIATVQPSNATYKTVTFSADDDSIVMVEEDGVITGLKPGTTMVYARAKDNSGKYAMCYVTVIAPVSATGVSVSDTEVVLMPGETKSISISMRPNNSTDTTTWSSGNEAVATVSGNGLITAVSTGTTNVTVMTTSGRTAVVKVTVLGLSRDYIEIPVYTKYTRLIVDGATTGVRWDVEDTSICQVANGVITARKKGTTYVTATVNGRTLRCKVKVY